MNRISHILVVVDPSEDGAQAAVDKAGHLAASLHASLELLICDIQSAHETDALSLRARTTSASTTRLLDLLDALAAPLRARGTEVTVRVIHGNSLHESLLEYLHGSNADLVIKDTHHHSLARRTLLRNTDWYLARECPVPLLLTKNKAWSPRPIIMAAVDPGQPSERAAALDRDILRGAAFLAGSLQGELHVIHTFVPAAFAAVVAAGGRSTTREYSEALQIENSFRRAQIEHFVGGFGLVPEQVHIEMGTPEDCLAGTVTKYRTDVMVMGSSLHGRWHRMVVGSTASTILESLPCDIFIIRSADGARPVIL